MTPTIEEREALFKAFPQALFAQDMDALYRTVAPDFVWNYHDGVGGTKCLGDRESILNHLEEQKDFFSRQRFHDVAYNHLPDESFMTFRVSETVRATGEEREQIGIERYTFRDGKIALKDVYRKPV
jgi:ketosteroid isomerase-like protein